MIAARQEAATDRFYAVGQRGTVRRSEVIAVVVSLVVIALLATVDFARNAHAVAPVVQATSVAAPPAGSSAPKPQPDDRSDRWAADESAQGTRPDATH